MKITVNLDSGLLARVVELTGARNRTEAITIALREVERRGRLVEILWAGTGASAKELKEMFDPASDPSVLRVAEDPQTYGGTHS